jgi:hypothetical protein
MRITILHGTTGFAGKQPHIIDVTPGAGPAHRSWRQRAKRGAWLLFAAAAIPVLWMIGVLVAMAVLGLAGLAAAALSLGWRPKR